MSPSYSTPTLHVIGRNDVIVIEERSKVLLEVSANKRVEEHDGGVYLFLPQAFVVPIDTLSSRSLRTFQSQLAKLLP
jgi:hypothetical protein